MLPDVIGVRDYGAVPRWEIAKTTSVRHLGSRARRHRQSRLYGRRHPRRPRRNRLHRRSRHLQFCRRLARPGDADLVGAGVFLMSSESDFMTGQTMVVDGGAVMH